MKSEEQGYQPIRHNYCYRVFLGVAIDTKEVNNKPPNVLVRTACIGRHISDYSKLSRIRLWPNGQCRGSYAALSTSAPQTDHPFRDLPRPNSSIFLWKGNIVSIISYTLSGLRLCSRLSALIKAGRHILSNIYLLEALEHDPIIFGLSG
jgi:hypothetical protein